MTKLVKIKDNLSINPHFFEQKTIDSQANSLYNSIMEDLDFFKSHETPYAMKVLIEKEITLAI